MPASQSLALKRGRHHLTHTHTLLLPCVCLLTPCMPFCSAVKVVDASLSCFSNRTGRLLCRLATDRHDGHAHLALCHESAFMAAFLAAFMQWGQPARLGGAYRSNDVNLSVSTVVNTQVVPLWSAFCSAYLKWQITKKNVSATAPKLL